jgi:hypothetical protein
MLPTKFRFIWLSSFKEEDFLEIDKNIQTAIVSYKLVYEQIGFEYFFYSMACPSFLLILLFDCKKIAVKKIR